MSKKIEEIMGKLKAAKTPEEIAEIVNAELPRTELSSEELGKVAGGTGRIELTDAQADKVVGGGHYYSDGTGKQLWIFLMDDGYELGTDPWMDKAYVLESLADAGFKIDVIIDTACKIFPLSAFDTKNAMFAGGPVYVALCVESANGYSMGGGWK